MRLAAFLYLSRCKILGTQVTATYHSDKRITCIIPSVPSTTSTSVEYTQNNVDWHLLGNIDVITPISITSITPYLGKSAGGTVVTVLGADFVNRGLLR